MKKDKLKKLFEYTLKDPKNWKFKDNKLTYEIGGGKFIYYDYGVHYENEYDIVKLRQKYSITKSILIEIKDFLKSTFTSEFWSDGGEGMVAWSLGILFMCVFLGVNFAIFMLGFEIINNYYCAALINLIILSLNPTIFYFKNKKYKYQFEILDKMMSKNEKEKYEKEIEREELEFQELLKNNFPNQIRAEKLKILNDTTNL